MKQLMLLEDKSEVSNSTKPGLHGAPWLQQRWVNLRPVHAHSSFQRVQKLPEPSTDDAILKFPKRRIETFGSFFSFLWFSNNHTT
mmetsp:Transcript_23271/g.32528  ORF Transcript_23271/g.32528 Transcript_23271/m.32528 type:complete len:85 (-) Transcript_23271:476-730(-)